MTLNASGPISLAGTTAGQSIEIELAGNGTTQISLNDTAVRTLAGVASGEITMPTNFWGKSSSSYWADLLFTTTSYNPCPCCCPCQTFNAGAVSSIQIAPSGTLYVAGFTYIDSSPYPTGYITTISSSGFVNTAYDADNNWLGGGFPSVAVDSNNIVYTSIFSNSETYRAAIKYSTNLSTFQNMTYSVALNNNSQNNLFVNRNNNVLYITNQQATALTSITAITNSTVNWSITLTGVPNSKPQLGFDSSNNVYASFMYNSGSINYLGIAKFNSSGTLQWQRRATTSNSTSLSQFTTDIAVFNSNGNIYVAGTFYYSSTLCYAALIKYNTSGTVQWQRTYTTAFSQYNSVILDSSENVYVCNYVFENPNYYLLLTKFNSSGTLQWQRKIVRTLTGSSNYFNNFSATKSLAIDSSNIYICGFGVQDSGTVIKYPLDGSKTGTYTGANFNVVITSTSPTFNTTAITDSAGATSFGTQSKTITIGASTANNVVTVNSETVNIT